ncbi:MAG: hypothetical protein K5657_02975 [Desulfovibrio sp.]|nr:hypothetical protein [Desulfovibrio sp.]
MYGHFMQGHHEHENCRGSEKKIGRCMAPGTGRDQGTCDGQGRGRGRGQGQCNGQGRGRGMGQGRGLRDGRGQCIHGEGGQQRGMGQCRREENTGIASEENVGAKDPESLPEEGKNA